MPDLEDLLAAEAARYDVRTPPVEVIDRRRKRRLLARSGAALTAFAVLGAGAGLAANEGADTLRDRKQRTAQEPVAAAQPTPAAGRSQSEEAASRDSVPMAVAELSFAERVQVLAQEEVGGGIWAISRMPGSPEVHGDVAGRYGVDWVNSYEYGELLLLDATGTRILRAVPLPGVPPQALRVHNDAVYCSRQGDGALPHSMLCRADRDGTASAVRVFTSSGPDTSAPPQLPAWTQQPAPPEADFASVVACPQGVCARAGGTMVPFHPATLVLPYDRARASDTAEACGHVQAAADAQRQVTSPTDSDWQTVESELYQAWRAGESGSDPLFVQNLVAPGSFLDGDTQSRGDAVDRLAGLCGIPVAG
jgi:hypothetical protein